MKKQGLIDAMNGFYVWFQSECLAICGAGEGIRTLDPNLGKVMLYP